MAKKKKIRKIVLISLLSLLGLLITVVILFFVFLEDIVDSRLNSLLEKKFGSYYTLDFDEIEKDIGFSEMTFVIKNARLKSDTTDIEGMEKFPIMFFQAEEMRIENLSTWDILWGAELDMSAIRLVAPDFILVNRKDLKKESDQKTNKRGKGLLTRLRLGEFGLEKGKLRIFEFHSRKKILEYISVNINVSQIELDLDNLDEIEHALDFNDLNVDAYNCKVMPLSGLYNFSLDSMQLGWNDQAIRIKNLRMEAKESLKETSKKKINNAEVFNVFMKEIELQGVDIERLVTQDELHIDKVELFEGQVEIFKNKLTKMESTFKKKVLNQIFRSIKFPVKIDTIQIDKLDLKFDLWAKSNRNPAKILLDDIRGYFANFNTKPEDNDTLNISIESVLMEKGLLTLNVDIAIWDSIKNYQKFSGNLRKMPFAVMNPTLRNFVNVKIQSGYVQRCDFAGYTNEWNSWGTIAFRYKDLAMDIYSFKDPEEKRKNKFLTGVAKMAIHKTNPLPNGDFRTADFKYTRQRWEGSVMQWLGGVLVGMLKTTLKDFVLDIIENESEKKVKQHIKKKAREQKKLEKGKVKKAKLEAKANGK